VIKAAIRVKGSLVRPYSSGRFLLDAKGHYLLALLPLGRIFRSFDDRIG
jgi:hypothetical protein